MGSVLASRVFGTYYLGKIRHDSTVLHYKRSPTWRSLLLFLVLFALTHIISTQAEIQSLGIICYVLGVYFCYLATEKYEIYTVLSDCFPSAEWDEECVFDKSKGTVSLMNARFIEKHLLGYRKKIVTELSGIVAVMVDSQKVLGADGYQVVLVFLTGLTLSLTAQCTYGDKREHESIAKEIKKFLDLSSASAQKQEEGERNECPRDKGRQKKPAKQKKDD